LTRVFETYIKSHVVNDFPKNVRLKNTELQAIMNAVRGKDPRAEVFLFGSRTHPSSRGGDIDVLILSDRIGYRDEWEIRRKILDEIGWQKLDLVVEKTAPPHRPIARIAQETGVRL